jgi:protein arginine N-methyltransferase 1
MLQLTTDTVLQRIPNLEIHTGSAGGTQIFAEGASADGGPRGLAIIGVFYRERTLGAALDLLLPPCAPMAERAALIAAIERLYGAGILRDAATLGPFLCAGNANYDSAPIHVYMLNDRLRVESFLKGIREVVQPGDVVIDMGTGTGVFAIAAAQAGARHVYAIDACGIGRLARTAFAANGFADRITLVHGWSAQVALPERADVLISEMVGNEPTGDFVLEVMRDARKRLLKPNARIVPGKVKVFGLPLTVPESELGKHIFTAEQARRWSEWYGVNLVALSADAYNALEGTVRSIRPYAARDWPTLSEPVLLTKWDLMNVQDLMIDVTVPVTATADGYLNGLLVYFEIELGPSSYFSLHPANVPHDSFRYSPLWILDHPRQLRAGEEFCLCYRYRVPNQRAGVSLVDS